MTHACPSLRHAEGSEFEAYYDDPNAFDTATTDSRVRFDYSVQLCVDKRTTQYPGHAGLCLGDVTASKALELMALYDDVLQPFDGQNGKLSVPILLQQASPTLDKHVLAAPQATFCSSSCTACTFSTHHAAKHNIWFNKDATRNAALAEVSSFFAQHTSVRHMLALEEPGGGRGHWPPAYTERGAMHVSTRIHPACALSEASARPHHVPLSPPPLQIVSQNKAPLPECDWWRWWQRNCHRGARAEAAAKEAHAALARTRLLAAQTGKDRSGNAGTKLAVAEPSPSPEDAEEEARLAHAPHCCCVVPAARRALQRCTPSVLASRCDAPAPRRALRRMFRIRMVTDSYTPPHAATGGPRSPRTTTHCYRLLQTVTRCYRRTIRIRSPRRMTSPRRTDTLSWMTTAAATRRSR